jgi:hypothetical protein
LGAGVADSAAGEISATAPKHSAARRLLSTHSEHRLSFSLENQNPRAAAVTPGSALMDKTVRILAQMGSVRHGILPARQAASKKTLPGRCETLGDVETKFSSRRGWKVRARIWLRIKFTGDEVVETLQGFEITEDRHPRKLADIPSADRNIRWVEKPPLRLNRLKQIIEAGFRFAESSIFEKAEDLQKKNLQNLYPALERLRSYYHQLAADTPGKDGEKADAIHAEYRRRLLEEVQRASVKATAQCVALETISTPVQHLKWQLKRNGNSRQVEAVLNRYDGCLTPAVRCEVCAAGGGPLGMSDSSVLVCGDCRASCDICGMEIVDRHAAARRTCADCQRIACGEHAVNCRTCGRLVCRDHQLQCQRGCRICPDCAVYCDQCGEAVIWCRNHLTANSTGDCACREHSGYCIGCRETYPARKTAACSDCGQSVCPDCRERCTHCGKNFCLSHIRKGRCRICRTQNSQLSLF